jgi:hypothetical protein
LSGAWAGILQVFAVVWAAGISDHIWIVREILEAALLNGNPLNSVHPHQ